MSYHYDVTWLIIYGSQIAALGELNTRGLIPIADLKTTRRRVLTFRRLIPTTRSNNGWIL